MPPPGNDGGIGLRSFGGLKKAKSNDIVELGPKVDVTAMLGLQFEGTEKAAGLRLAGTYRGNDQFQVDQSSASRTHRIRLVGRIQEVRQLSGDRVALRLFDREIVARGSLELKEVESVIESLEFEDTL